MSALGQKRTFVGAMGGVRFVPIAAVGPHSHSITSSARPSSKVTSELAISIVDNSP